PLRPRRLLHRAALRTKHLRLQQRHGARVLPRRRPLRDARLRAPAPRRRRGRHPRRVGDVPWQRLGQQGRGVRLQGVRERRQGLRSAGPRRQELLCREEQMYVFSQISPEESKEKRL
ncbi:hypothetical protein N0V92_013946, partial [Colletotrichum tropicale]